MELIKKVKSFLSLVALLVLINTNANTAEECFENTSRAIFKFNMAIDEAILVRNKSSKPILLLQGIYDLDEYKEVLKYDLDFVIHSDWQLKNLEEGLKNNRLWLKLNTGLNRLGFNAEKFESIIKVLEQKGFINLVLMSHFACADEKGHPLNNKQLQLFEKVTKKFTYKKSLANSGAVFNYPEAHYDIVRPGISV